jgi:hypothetical protein
MLTVLKWLFALLVGSAIFLAVLYLLPDGQARSALNSMKATARQTIARTPDPDLYQQLPAPVKAWLDQAAPPASGEIIIARISQSGLFRPEGNRWPEMKAEQYFLGRPPAFVWTARIWLMPLVWLQGRDIFLNQVGSFHGSLMSLAPLIGGIGPETNQASLQRWISEAVWFPTALWPSERVEWIGISPKQAKVVVTYGELKAEGEFIFGEDGLPQSFMCRDRYRDLPTGMKQQPWQVKYSDYKRLKGYLIPTRGDVAWLPQGGEYPYGRIKVDGVWFNAEALAQ